MSKFNKRKSVSFAVIFIFALIVAFSGCGKSVNNALDGAEVLNTGFSVHYLDVGQGDCIFIKFSDGKTALIDCGAQSKRNQEYIVDYLNSYSVDKIDYFILTHPDNDHVGNAKAIIDNFDIGKAFVPFVMNLNLFPVYGVFYDALIKKEVSLDYSDMGDGFSGEDYFMAFLSPLPKELADSSYSILNGATAPNDTAVNNVSPIIYLESNGYRFVFTGDAGATQEDLVIENYSSGYYNILFENKTKINLDKVDFLKVSHHGSRDATGAEFLSVLKPKNAVVSVGGNNFYGHPATETLLRLKTANENYNLYRTDVKGSIVAYLDDGILKTITDAD